MRLPDDTGITFPIVGIGASAGGLEALRELVTAVPARSGMCYVVVQHLAADHPSIMDQLLGDCASVPVCKIEDGMAARPDTIFVIPAGPELTISGGRFHLHFEARDRGLRTPIDRFFKSLAEEMGSRAYCVILSGTGSDGTAGLRVIKASGGIAVSQEGRSARFSGMPDNAVATGLVDLILRPSDIPGRLIQIDDHRNEYGLEQSETLQQQIQARLPRIVSLIDDGSGHDFRNYKPGTLIRRIERRMALLRQSTVDAFVEVLTTNPDERRRLLQDFLIGVTEFFRHREAFDTLRDSVIARIFERKPERVRIWVPGCSTGEEAFSIAILCLEMIEKAGRHVPTQIFGTDVDLGALSRARSGLFPLSSLESLDEDRRRQYFTIEGEKAQIVPRLREMCIFAPHNVLSDPPYSRLDLISCRNVFIYLNADVQARLITRFHYALNPSGYLFLGPSETLGQQERYFTTLNKELRIYQRNDDERIGFSALSEAPARAGRRQNAQMIPVSAIPLRSDISAAPAFEGQVDQFVLRRYAPPYAIINGRNEVSYLSEAMGPYVSPTQGVPSAALDSLLVRELRLPVRTAVAAARERDSEAIEQNIIVQLGRDKHVLDVIAAPVPFQDSAVAVILRQVRVEDADDLTLRAEARLGTHQEIIERELELTRRQLSSVISEHAAVDQELRSSNEELLSMNEELQSANEELETSREELQSINEELETVNAELTENNRQLTRANSDLKNIFESTEIATLFLDSQLCVRRFTPATSQLFGVKERDIGRPLEDLSSQVPYDTIREDAVAVMDSLVPVSREISISSTGDTFIMRTRSYRTVDDRLDGCVVSFFDITERKRGEIALKESEQRYRSVIEAHSEMLCRFRGDGTLLLANEAYARAFGKPLDELIGKSFYANIPVAYHALIEETLQSLTPQNPTRTIENEIVAADGSSLWTEWTNTLISSAADENPLYQSIGRDVTARKLAEFALRESEERFRVTFDNAAIGMSQVDLEGRRLRVNKRYCEIVGYPESELVGHRWQDITHSEDLASNLEHMKELLEGRRESFEIEKRYVRKDGSAVWVNTTVAPVRGGSGKVEYFIKSIQNIGDYKHIIGQLTDSERRMSLLMRELQHRVKNTMAIIVAIVRFSGKSARSYPELVNGVQSRLAAISRTHDVLTAQNWAGDRLKDVLDRELSPYIAPGRNRYSFEGTDIALDAKQALTLSLAVHELATNAAKYGALSNEDGYVVVRSHSAGEKRWRVEWEEFDGPRIDREKAGAEGFGSFIIRRVLAADLDGEIEFSMDPSGVRFIAEFEAGVRDAPGP